MHKYKQGYLLGAGDEGGSGGDVRAALIAGAVAVATCDLAVPPRGRARTPHEFCPTLSKVTLQSTVHIKACTDLIAPCFAVAMLTDAC